MSHDEIVQLIKRAIYCGKINGFSAKLKERKIIHHSLNMAKKRQLYVAIFCFNF